MAYLMVAPKVFVFWAYHAADILYIAHQLYTFLWYVQSFDSFIIFCNGASFLGSSALYMSSPIKKPKAIATGQKDQKSWNRELKQSIFFWTSWSNSGICFKNGSWIGYFIRPQGAPRWLWGGLHPTPWPCQLCSPLLLTLQALPCYGFWLHAKPLERLCHHAAASGCRSADPRANLKWRLERAQPF